MISTKETAVVRLEIEYEVLVGELSILEDDYIRMTLKDFLDAWGPETTKVRFQLLLKEMEFPNDESRG